MRLANLSGANLSGTDLTKANLDKAFLSRANCSRTHLSQANCTRSRLSGTNFSEALLNGTNFSEADLSEANLSEADLRLANLSNADLSNADLSNANLSRTRVSAANFAEAQLTGVCLENWKVNSATNFQGVICDYVYLKDGQHDRRPKQGNFASGEFNQLFNPGPETIKLVFRHGVVWEAFACSYRKVAAVHKAAHLDTLSIEKKGDGTVVVKVGIASGANPTQIQTDLMKCYDSARRALEAQATMEGKNGAIDRLFSALYQARKRLNEVSKPLAETSSSSSRS